MPVRRRRNTKTRRVRRARKMSMRRTRSVPDGTYSEKLTYDADLYVDAATTFASTCFHWIRSGNGAATELFPLGTTPGNAQYSQCATMFRSYKITGLRIEYRPYMFQLTNAGMKSILVGTTMDHSGAWAVPAPISVFRASLDSKEYDPTRPFKRFYHVGRWAANRSINWRTTDEANVNAYGNTTPDCITSLHVDCTGFAAG